MPRHHLRLEHLIFTQGWTARETNKTQAFPTISAIWASGRWVCLGLLGTISRTQFRTQADVICHSWNETQAEWSTHSLASRRILLLFFILIVVSVTFDGSTAPVSRHGFVFGLEP